MTFRLRFPTLFDAFTGPAPMQDTPVRVAVLTGLASVAAVATAIAL